MVPKCPRTVPEAPRGPAEYRRVLAAGTGGRRASAWRALLSALALLPALGAEPFLCTFVDRNEKPLGNVEARLRAVGGEGAADLPPLYRKSNKEGVAKFPELLPGEYILDSQLRGYVRVSQRLTAGKDLSVRRTLLKKNEFERIERRARQDLDASEFLSAARGIESLLEFYPEDALLHDALARAYAGLDDEARALEEARIAARLDPEGYGGADLRVQTMLLRSRGEQALQGFNLAAALDAFESLKELAPDDPLAYEGLALTYGHLGRIDEALKAVGRAMELDPDNPQLAEIRGVLAGMAGGP